MPESDVVIVRGGLHGAALAFELASSGRAVTLLARRELASGASGGLGLRGVRTTDRDVRELPLMRLAHDIWPTLDAVLGAPGSPVDAGFRRTGSVCLFDRDEAADPRTMARIRTMAAVQTAHSIPAEVIDAEALRAIEPGLADVVAGAIATPLDDTGDHTRATLAYAAAARRAGATILEGTEVTSLADRAATTSDEVVHRARIAVVVLANAYAPALLEAAFGLRLPVWRIYPQMTPVRAADGFAFRGLVNHVSRIFSAKTIDGGLVMLSGGRSGEWDEAADAGTAPASVAAASVAGAAELAPSLHGAEAVVTDASRPESVSVDGIPIIDRVLGTEGVLFATGWSGHGFAITPAVARLLAEWVRSSARPPLLAPFALARLSAPAG
ncbi:FAD-binding oxidoreductase [Agrococcus sp. SL85]|uniref:NAD(P)/FAD-dependent oxidoreductase n=1 Tax=Agrococcus sp. SL85 TaxID=2995141 RepID=UPI00226CACA8|nr:FAD-binding oxidoreductase [Agrococcus sp. SL85]WAC66017.1 FAD-binding oxidoreductase [Agrococcus sp. SL85]